MSKQDDFEVSLDVEENIISCVAIAIKIHLGEGFEGMLEKIYAERKELLKSRYRYNT